ncbi:MAG: hypothetical protein U1E28_06620 [Beijerinckiaceae bacterium]
MLRPFFTGLALLALAVPAHAAPKATKRPPAAIEIANERTVALKSFTLSTTGAKPKTVAKLDKPIAPGGKAKVKLAGKGCDYVARWEFEDAGDESQVDLCHDPRIVLTD